MEFNFLRGGKDWIFGLDWSTRGADRRIPRSFGNLHYGSQVGAEGRFSLQCSRSLGFRPLT